MKRLVSCALVAAFAAVLAPSASAGEVCVPGIRTPYPTKCVVLPDSR